jgi:hypothetical protein
LQPAVGETSTAVRRFVAVCGGIDAATSAAMNNQLETIEHDILDDVCGGIDWGATHTVLTQALACAGGGAMVGGSVSGPYAPIGAAVGAAVAGTACAATSYLAMRQQAQQPPASPQPAAPQK